MPLGNLAKFLFWSSSPTNHSVLERRHSYNTFVSIKIYHVTQQPKEACQRTCRGPNCSVIIGKNPIQANANTGAIQLPRNPSAPLTIEA